MRLSVLSTEYPNVGHDSLPIATALDNRFIPGTSRCATLLTAQAMKPMFTHLRLYFRDLDNLGVAECKDVYENTGTE
jgi:hypothetical protein